ncbi:MAG: MATE family efflux transporter [Prevotellaceae bacterium]|jgi:MATE family multidrug resistance protein|nr:MATE family efflux transporter [Prevotellaceae bacterium]
MHKTILRLAFPNIITNITVPLLGLVDLAIVGHIGDKTYIAAIAVATMIFNIIYWIFGFLRMGTSGFTAQSYGANDMPQAAKILVRSLSVAFFIALLLIVLQIPVFKTIILLIDGSEHMQSLVFRYFSINIWAAPAILGLYGLKGWFIGMQNAKVPMWIAIFINLLNICLGLFFVFVLKMDIEGVALGTVLAQYSGLAAGICFFLTKYKFIHKYLNIRESLIFSQMTTFLKVNSDIFFRSVCLTAVFAFFPVAGSKIGESTLATNALLMQFFTIFSYIMDGFAYAGEALTGRFIGAKDNNSLKKCIKLLFVWGTILSLFFMVIYAAWGQNMLSFLTDKQEIVALAKEFYWWVLLVPLTGFAAFLWDGIFVGATASRAMLITILIATIFFFAIYLSLNNIMGNNALWFALIMFLLLRGLAQTFFAKKAIFEKIEDAQKQHVSNR